MGVNVSTVGRWLQAQKKKWLLERGDLGSSASPGEPLRAQGHSGGQGWHHTGHGMASVPREESGRHGSLWSPSSHCVRPAVPGHPSPDTWHPFSPFLWPQLERGFRPGSPGLMCCQAASWARHPLDTTSAPASPWSQFRQPRPRPSDGLAGFGLIFTLTPVLCIHSSQGEILE